MRKKDRIPLNSVGVIIKEGREKKDIGIKELAWKINNPKVSPKTIRNWEKGQEFPDLNMIYKLAEILDLNPNEMLKLRNQIQEESYTAEGSGAIRRMMGKVVAVVGPSMSTIIKIVAGGCVIYLALWLNDMYMKVGGDDQEQVNFVKQVIDNSIDDWVNNARLNTVNDATDTVIDNNVVNEIDEGDQSNEEK